MRTQQQPLLTFTGDVVAVVAVVKRHKLPAEYK